MRYLLHAATRRARWLILRERIDVLRYGYDAAELYLALHYLAWAFVMWLPDEATRKAPAWRVLRQVLAGDLGVGIVCTLLGVPLLLGVLRLLSASLHLITLWVTLGISAAFSVALLIGNPLAVSAYDSAITAFICWLVFLRADRNP